MYPIPPLISWLFVQSVPQSVPVPVALDEVYVMWSPYTAHQYVVSVTRCWYGHVPHSCHAAFAEQAMAEVVVPIGRTTAPGVLDSETAGVSPTACTSDRPAAIDTVAPGAAAAARASWALTARVVEPLWTAAGAAIRDWACAWGSGCGPPAEAVDVKVTVETTANRLTTTAAAFLRLIMWRPPFELNDSLTVALPVLTNKMAIPDMAERSAHKGSFSFALAGSARMGAAVQENGGFDVLVVGSGASGLAAAACAERAGSRVALATKGSIQSCNSAKAQGGIQAAFGEDDSPEQHAEDVWKSSHETANMALVQVLTSEAPSAIHWLEELGVAFTKENGGYRLARCGGASRKRLLQVGDRTGHAITAGLRDAVEAGSVTTFPKSPLAELEPAEHGWRARCGEHTLEASTVILAAGGRCFAEAEQRGELSTNHPGATGEVTRIALAAGAEARDLDALQYHPNGGAWPETMQGYSIPETTRAYGAVLLNAEGEEFTDSLGPLDVVSQAIFDEVAGGRGVETPDGRPAVWLDTTRIDPHDAELSLPYMLRRYRAGGIDPLQEKILTYPVLHYQNGGLVIDTDAETTLEGVYACGEIAGGTHGRNRMMGNSLLECVVFGRRAGKAAAEKAKA